MSLSLFPVVSGDRRSGECSNSSLEHGHGDALGTKMTSMSTLSMDEQLRLLRRGRIASEPPVHRKLM